MNEELTEVVEDAKPQNDDVSDRRWGEATNPNTIALKRLGLLRVKQSANHKKQTGQTVGFVTSPHATGYGLLGFDPICTYKIKKIQLSNILRSKKQEGFISINNIL